MADSSNGWTPADYVGLANSVATFGGQVYAANMGKRSRKAYIKLAKEMAEYNNQMAEKHWQMQNEYNAPSAQMARYKEAGLNPYLVYGNMENSAGAISTPAAETPDISEPVGFNPLKALSDSVVAYQNIVAQEQANTNAKIQSDILAAQAVSAQAKAEMDQFKARHQEEKYSVEKAILDTKNQRDAFELTLSQKYKEQEILVGLEKKKQDIDSMKIGDREKEARIRQIDEQIELTKKQVSFLDDRAKYLKWQMDMGERRYSFDVANAQRADYWRGQEHKLRVRAQDSKEAYQNGVLKNARIALGWQVKKHTDEMLYRNARDRRDWYNKAEQAFDKQLGSVSPFGIAGKIF